MDAKSVDFLAAAFVVMFLFALVAPGLPPMWIAPIRYRALLRMIPPPTPTTAWADLADRVVKNYLAVIGFVVLALNDELRDARRTTIDRAAASADGVTPALIAQAHQSTNDYWWVCVLVIVVATVSISTARWLRSVDLSFSRQGPFAARPVPGIGWYMALTASTTALALYALHNLSEILP